MAAQAAPPNGPRRNLPRLNLINPSISYSQQQAQALFSPALQATIHTGVGSAFPLHTPMQPFFGGHNNPPPAPFRHGHQVRASMSHFPAGQNHNAIVTPTAAHFSRPSMMLGHGAPLLPFTIGPGGPGQPLGPITLNNGPPPPGQRPHRRQMSIGGPPKAVLGGPQRKVSPNPSAVAIAAVGAATAKRKITVNLPKESELVNTAGYTEQEAVENSEQALESAVGKTRVSKEWARIPLSVAEGEAIMASYIPMSGEQVVSREPLFPEEWRKALPASIDVFLPGKATWDLLKQQVIEAKLEKLGVERGSGSNVPHIFAPHARAASISSPADPALLLFRLNKLQQAQRAHALSPSIANSNSLAPSPQLPIGLSPPPQNRRPSLSALGPNGHLSQCRHGHTMSLAQPPSYNRVAFSPFPPFSGSMSIADELERPLSTVSDGGVPVFSSQSNPPDSVASLTVPHHAAISRPGSRPDLIPGFGLDVPEEAEEEAELDEQEREQLRWKQRQEALDNDEQSAIGQDFEDQDESGHTGDTEDDDRPGQIRNEEDDEMDLEKDTTSRGGTTTPHNRIHSRHVSRLSAALSLRSVGGNLNAIMGSRREGSGLEDNDEMDGDVSFMGRESSPPPLQANRRPPLPLFGHAVNHSISANREDLEDAVAVQEWTGSEGEDGVISVADTSDFDDDQSLGEYSNPSDEERARRQRVSRRMDSRADKEDAKRRKLLINQRRHEEIEQDVELVEGVVDKEEFTVDQPRRIPNFPRPPDNTLVFVPTQREHYHHSQPHPPVYSQPHHQHEQGTTRDRDEIISNPSEENLAMGPYEYRYPPSAGAAMPYPPPHPPHHHPYQQPLQFLPRSPGSAHQLSSMPGVGPVPHSHSRGPSETLSYASHGHRPNQGSFCRVAPPPQNPHYTHQHQNSFGQAPPAFMIVPQPQPEQAQRPQSSGISSARRDSLNPFAKPFVFGRPLDAKAEPWQPSPVSIATSTTPSSGSLVSAPSLSRTPNSAHSRLSSLGRALNVAAPEFKPRSAVLPPDAEFTFSMPTVSPAFPVPEASAPLSALAAVSIERDGGLYEDGSPIKKQGREKRPRLGSSHALGGEDKEEFVEDEIIAEARIAANGVLETKDGESSHVEEDGSMASFRFPGPARIESPKIIRKVYSHQPQQVQASVGIEKASSLDGSFCEGRRGEDDNGDDEFGSEMDMEDVDSEEEDKENRREDTPVPASTSTSMIAKPVFSISSGTENEKKEGELNSEGNDTQDTEMSPAKASQGAYAIASGSDEVGDDDEYVQELIIPPTLPITNLSATFPTSATMKSGSGSGSVNFSSITGTGGKARRAPIPLDFKHPSGNTVPAGRFKALQNVIQQNAASNANEDRTRCSVRSRLGSGEIYEMHHMSRPSMDDLNVTKISGTGLSSSKSLSTMNANANRRIHLPNFTGTVANRSRNATEPIPNLSKQEDDEDVFGSRNANSSGAREGGIHRRRRSSLPDALRGPSSSGSPSENGREKNDDDLENHASLNANASHTMHLTRSGRRVLRSLSISRSPSPEESSRIRRTRRSETRSRSPSVLLRDLTTPLELHALEDVLSRVLDERLSELRREWNTASTNENGLSSPSEAMLHEVISLFRAQLQDSAAKSLEDTTMDVRGEMDVFMIKDMLEEGQREVVGVVKTVVEEHLHQAVVAAQEAREGSRGSEEILRELKEVVEGAAGRTVSAVIDTITDLRARQDAAVGHSAYKHKLVDELVTTLTPMLQGLRPEPIDYDFLTNHLAQAVKPHISQLIDLASDKRETAELIVDALIPMLVNGLVPTMVPTLAPNLISLLAPTLAESLSEVLRAESDETRLGVVREVKKAVEGVDAIEIRERVADLVVERLDARLDARDKSFIAVVNSSIADASEKISKRLDANESVKKQQEKKSLTEEDLKGVEKSIVDGVRTTLEKVAGVPQMLEEWFDRVEQDKVVEQEKTKGERSAKMLQAIEGMVEKAASQQDVSNLEQRVVSVTSEAAQGASKSSLEIKALLEALVAENKALSEQNTVLVASHQKMAVNLDTLPEILNSSIANLQNGISELIVSRDVPKKELDELKKQNSEYQIQVTKARAAHGQVRVEKDLLGEKLVVVESERDRLRVKIADLEHGKREEMALVEARKNELEEALSNALGRLQASDVASQMYQQRIAELEKAVKEAGAEKTALKANADAFEIRATVAEREKMTAAAMLEAVRKEQGHWESLRQASDKIDMLTKLIGEVESDEIKDLRRYHDKTKAIEAENLALQKRYKDLENKLGNSEKVAAATTSSLLQAQQRSAEWETRAKEYEGELEMVRTKLEQAEQTQNQLDADHSLLKLHFEEREADDRLNKDRDNKQREHINALEAKVVRLQDELAKARPGPRTPYRNVTNSTTSHPPPRPDSRASISTVNGRGEHRLSSYSPATNNGTTSATPSVWDSIHAPSTESSHVTPNSRLSSAGGVSGSIHTPQSKYPNLGLASTPRYPLITKKSAYSSTYSSASAYSRDNAPSPAPSNVSVAPTQRDDGWWE